MILKEEITIINILNLIFQKRTYAIDATNPLPHPSPKAYVLYVVVKVRGRK